MVLEKIKQYLEKNNYQISCSVSEFVNVVSNIYHEIESKNYNKLHKVMFDVSSHYWDEIIQSNITLFKEQLIVLDYGCGTGFAIENILKSALKPKIKMVICYDLSSHMIDECKKNIYKNHKDLEHIDFIFHSGTNGYEEVKKINYDFIMTNALLHHLVDLKSFFNFIKTNLNKNGLYILGHEPNTDYYSNYELIQNTKRFQKYKRIKSRLNVKYILDKLKIIKQPRKNIFNETNTKLLSKKIINKELPNNIIPKLVDIHVPIGLSKNQIWGEIGFNSELILNKYLIDFKLVDVKTYFHIKDYKAYKSAYWKNIIKKLKAKYPKDGADCIMLFKRD